VLLAFNKRTAAGFVEIVGEGTLKNYYWHHIYHEYLILMEDGAPILHCINAQKFWMEQLRLTRLEWLANSCHLNAIKNV